MKNELQNDPSSDYYTREKSSIEALIPPGSHRVLDVGCAAGGLGRRLIERGKAAEVYGLELFEPAARKAAEVYKSVLVGDVESLALTFPCQFDYIVCGDILEHLREPAQMLKRLLPLLAERGQFIVSLPNIRNYRVLINLVLHGEWQYRDSGILDYTHLRFYTRKSAVRMVTEAGLTVDRVPVQIYGPKKLGFNRLTLGLFEEFLATQIMMCARRGDSGK